MVFMTDKNYWDALDAFDAMMEHPSADKKLTDTIKFQTKKAEEAIAAERDPLLAQGKQFEQDGKMADAYRSYQKAYEVDPTDNAATDGMNRIRGTLTGKAKSIYAEGVFAESYGDMDAAEKQYRQVLEVVPNDDAYYVKAQSRLKRLTVLRKPASESAQ
jgi:tetratricopeptide (TPR) repeat protein